MKKVFAIFLTIVIAISFAWSQFPSSISVSSDGSVITSPVTEEGKLYRITVTGTYSMWPQFVDCHGVDAGYVYEVPQEEIDSFRWPPDTIRVGDIRIPFVTMPHWVGDPQVWRFPPIELGMPAYEISFRKHKGFRIDDEPLPNTGIDLLNHRYQIEKTGTGKPFQFQILDSNYSIFQERVIPRYEDNCGSLQVIIEEVNDEIDLNICDLTILCDSLGNIVGLKVDAALFVEDTSHVQNRKNLLQFIDPDQLGIVENGKFKCDIRIECSDSTSEKPISVGILIDRSGSMSLPISEWDNTERMQASKQSINNFIDNFKTQDSAFIMSFSNDITYDLDWSNDKQKLKNAVNSLEPYGMTQLYGAILSAIEKVSESSNTRRALVVLSDGCNTIAPDWTDDILTIIQNKNIPIFIIALGLSDDPCDIQGRQKMGLMANASRGKIYDVYSSSELDSVYSKLSSEIALDECCSIYFDIDPCETGEKRFVRLFYTPSDTVVITKVISFVCDSCESITSGISEGYENDFKLRSNINDLSIYPNPVINNSIIKFNVQTPGYVKIALFDGFGNIKFENNKYYSEPGNYFYSFTNDNLSSGVYIATVFFEGFSISRKVIVIR